MSDRTHVDDDPVTRAGISLAAGAVTTSLWCPICKAFTVLTGEVWAFTRTGLAQVGTWTWCEICGDPGSTDAQARTSHA